MLTSIIDDRLQDHDALRSVLDLASRANETAYETKRRFDSELFDAADKIDEQVEPMVEIAIVEILEEDYEKIDDWDGCFTEKQITAAKAEARARIEEYCRKPAEKQLMAVSDRS